MKSNREPIRNWFGYSRKERRSAFILLLIIILIIGLRYTIPERYIAIEDLSASNSGIESHDRFIKGEISNTRQPFLFDPNTASYDTLIELGLAPKEANILIKYRNKGGKFRNPSDIKKVYGINEEQAAKLIPFIKAASVTSEKFKSNSFKQDKPLLDINRCDSASLVALPGIGPVLSVRIIKYRHLLGGFAFINQLKEVYGLPVETFDLIKGRLFADSAAIIRININSADYEELSRLPYFEKYELAAILKYRELKGSIKGIIDLTENKLITEEKAKKVRPYLRFE
jgi:competence protein ComEA